MKKRINLQPWLDYFEMLVAYENKGFLQVDAKKHEAYVTQPALATLAAGGSSGGYQELSYIIANGTKGVASRIRAYSAWCSQEDTAYMERPFALHVVQSEQTHDLICTVLLTRRRRWWKLFMKADNMEIITYDIRQNG